MMESVNTVTPFRRPAISEKYGFKIRSWILADRINDRPIEQNRQVFVIRNPPVTR